MRRLMTASMMVLALTGVGCSIDASHAWLGGMFGPEQREEFTWRGAVASGRTLEIKGVNGSVRAEATSGTEVELIAIKKGRRHDPGLVKIEVVEHAGGVTICAVYPTSSGDAPNECVPGRGGRMKVKNNDVSVQFRVRIPAGVHFVGRTVNGQVAAAGLKGNAIARTVNGSVDIEASGHGEAQTINGSITASLGRGDWAGRLEFRTVNGGITVELPGDVAAEVEAETVNGGITTDFPLTVQGRFGPRHLRGTIGGGGGRELSLTTVNGSIRLRQAS